MADEPKDEPKDTAIRTIGLESALYRAIPTLCHPLIRGCGTRVNETVPPTGRVESDKIEVCIHKMVPYVQDMPRARCVALTQEHRGHGVSTAAYYLGRVLVSQGLRVLLIEATGRRARLQSLIAQNPVKNLVLWTPNVAQPHDLQPALERARRETAGHADVLLLDIDAALLEHARGLELGIDYVVAVTEPTSAGQAAADHIAEHLHDAQPPHGRVGVVFSRVDAPAAGDLPERTEHRHLPVIGYYPADYLLAGGDAYSLKGGDSSYPHDTYLYALLRLGQKLAQIVPLERVPRCAPVDQHVPPAESNGQQLA